MSGQDGPDRSATGDVFDVVTAQTDIVQLLIGQALEFAAGPISGESGADQRHDPRHKMAGTTHGKASVRFNGGHGDTYHVNA